MASRMRGRRLFQNCFFCGEGRWNLLRGKLLGRTFRLELCLCFGGIELKTGWKSKKTLLPRVQREMSGQLVPLNHRRSCRTGRSSISCNSRELLTLPPGLFPASFFPPPPLLIPTYQGRRVHLMIVQNLKIWNYSMPISRNIYFNEWATLIFHLDQTIPIRYETVILIWTFKHWSHCNFINIHPNCLK